MSNTISELLSAMPSAFLSEKAEGIDASVLLNVLGNEAGQYTIVIKDKKCSVQKGSIPNPKLTLTANSQDLLDVFSGKLDGMKAFMSGKLKLLGDIGLALKLTSLFKTS